ncbi:hypothetical protein [Phenylobacterium sp.]
MGRPNPITPAALEATAPDTKTHQPQKRAGPRVVDAQTREIERIDPSYKT